MTFFVWAIACVLVSNAYGSRQQGTHMELRELTPSEELLKGAYDGDLKKVEAALAKGAPVDSLNENNVTALWIAAVNGYVEVAKKLLAEGADIQKICGPFAQSALNKAAEEGQLEMVQLLLDNGASVESANRDGWTPLIQAVFKDHAEVVKLLLNKKANAAHLTSDGRNALHFASAPEIIEMLLEKHVNVNQIDKDGESPLLKQAWNNSQVVKLFLDAGADPNVKSTRSSASTPLHEAARYGRVEIVKMLLAKEADVNARNPEGETPLDFVKDWYVERYDAPKGDQKEVEKILIDAGGFQKNSWASMADRVKSALSAFGA